MDSGQLLASLGYSRSANCLRGRDLSLARDYGHVFRRASESAGLDAVYCLRAPAGAESPGASIVPVTYVCKAGSFDDADDIHRRVWNQNVVPFLIVLAPQGVRVYGGFEREHVRVGGSANHVIECDLAEVAERLNALSSRSIDDGTVWSAFGERVRPERRVEWHLLKDLEDLQGILLEEGLDDRALVHTLIGKLLYLHYLRHRGILSDVRLARWSLNWGEVATRSAKVASFLALCGHLDEWLNGSVFPLNKRAMTQIGAKVLQRAAGIFAGDSPDGQLHLGFDAYDFSYIPIETLSVVYEQFLHTRQTGSGVSAGRSQGAYYTPIPVVNFLLDRMDEISPLRSGMRVLDPSCGSGAFLVQCYRKLIEDRLRSLKTGEKLRPTELRDLLVKHIFGMDVDAEACRVAELSLVLTMLDYVDPPDLTATTFKLPSLSGTNIFEANAFDETSEPVALAKAGGFDWIVGNPPWNELTGGATNPIDAPVLDWMRQHKRDKPTGGNQTAEAFAWRTQDFANEDAIAALLLPAMVLFKDESENFRKTFFRANPPVYVANFANLAEVLFGGRSRVPAAGLIFRAGPTASEETLPERVPVFSPLVANQELTRPRAQGSRVDTWSIVVDESECRPVDRHEIEGGKALVWKMAAWGSAMDRTIVRRTLALPTLEQVMKAAALTASEGMQLRSKSTRGGEPVEHHPELEKRVTLNVSTLATLRRVFAFPREAIEWIPADKTYVRAGRYRLPESVSRPPHVLVSAARNWAVFSDKYMVVPPRQIGIAGPPAQTTLLKALTLYLNSEFVQYHQFFTSTEAGVKRPRSTLKALRSLPIPRSIADGDSRALQAWAELHDELVAGDVRMDPGQDTPARTSQKEALLVRLNDSVNKALRLRSLDSVRISDVVNVMFGLHDGKVEERAVRPPEAFELRIYADRLQREINAFIGGEARVKHSVDLWTDGRQGVIQLHLRARDATVTIHSEPPDASVISQAVALRAAVDAQFAQWRYFNRNLRLFVDNRVYLFKPMQLFHWLESEAVSDAAEVIGLVLEHAS